MSQTAREKFGYYSLLGIALIPILMCSSAGSANIPCDFDPKVSGIFNLFAISVLAIFICGVIESRYKSSSSWKIMLGVCRRATISFIYRLCSKKV